MVTKAKRHGVTRNPKLLADVGEQGVLERLARRIGVTKDKGVLLGMGDDGAVLRVPRGASVVVSTDVLVEGVDFARAWASFTDIGHKAAAVNLSDLAAMGAQPTGLVIALSAQPTEQVAHIVDLLASAHAVGASMHAPLVGGDLSRTSGPLSVAVTALGTIDPACVLRRHRGRPGDVVLVSGMLGAAAAGLWWLQYGHHANKASRVPRAMQRALMARQLRPTARVDLGMGLAKSGLCRSAADISDGLFKDAHHVVGPGCAAEIHLDRLPIAPGVAETAQQMGCAPWHLACGGGEDFELVMAAAPQHVPRILRLAARLGIGITAVGAIKRADTKNGCVQFVDGAGRMIAQPHAFEHFTQATT